jgi:GH24 family phage-related lysozyme (muramidase)
MNSPEFFENLFNFIAIHEGCSSLEKGKNKFFSGVVDDNTLIYPYLDVTGTATIGYGNTIYKDNTKVSINDKPIKFKEAKILMLDYLILLDNKINSKLTVILNENQRIAIISLMYNVGKFTTILNFINKDENDKTNVAKFFKQFIFSKGIKLQGLINRRENEIKKFFFQNMSNIKQNISTRVLSLVVNYEDFSEHAILKNNKYFLGFGSKQYANGKKVIKGDFITLPDAKNLLVRELNIIFKIIKEKTKNNTQITQTKIEALTSLAYNTGIDEFLKSSLFLENIQKNKDLKKETFINYKTQTNTTLKKQRLDEYYLYYSDSNIDVSTYFDKRFNFDEIYNKKKKPLMVQKSKYDNLHYYDKDNSAVGQLTTALNKVNAALLNNWLVVVSLVAVVFITLKLKK